MDKNELKKIVNYIVEQGLFALKDTNEKNAIIDYVAIFSKNDRNKRH